MEQNELNKNKEATQAMFKKLLSAASESSKDDALLLLLNVYYVDDETGKVWQDKPVNGHDGVDGIQQAIFIAGLTVKP